MNEANLDKGYIRSRGLIGDCRSEAFLYVKSSRVKFLHCSRNAAMLQLTELKAIRISGQLGYPATCLKPYTRNTVTCKLVHVTDLISVGW